MRFSATHIHDEAFMRQALKLAADTTGLASPNPQVGCILVSNGEVIGEGAHLYDNRDHAEIVALKQAAARGLSPRGATAYVTLEPCSHHGRTPPCADSLIAAGITRCVIATKDPNPQVSGQGIEKLRAAGIEVTLGVLQQQARDLNDAFAHYIRTRTPFVTLKAALSSDGKLAPPPASRFPNQAHWLTGPAARHEVQLLRHASDAVLTGIGTVLADNPLLTDRSGLFGPGMVPRRRPLLRVILDTRLRTPLDSQLFRSVTAVQPISLFSAPAPRRHPKINSPHRKGRSKSRSIPSHAGRLSLSAGALPRSPIATSSASSSNAAHTSTARSSSQNLVDKVVLIHSPTELGGQAIPFAAGHDTRPNRTISDSRNPRQLRPRRMRHGLSAGPMGCRFLTS